MIVSHTRDFSWFSVTGHILCTSPGLHNPSGACKLEYLFHQVSNEATYKSVRFPQVQFHISSASAKWQDSLASWGSNQSSNVPYTRRGSSTLARLELFPTIGDVIFVWLIVPVVPELIADTVASTVEGAGPPIIHHTKRRGLLDQHWAPVVAQRALSQVRARDIDYLAYAHPVLPVSGLPGKLQSLY